MLMSDRKGFFETHFLAYYLKLNEAISQLTADMVAADSDVFLGAGGNIRYVAERQLFFALFADRSSFEYFVAANTGGVTSDANDLSVWVRLVAPYFGGSEPVFTTPGWCYRKQRERYRLQGESDVRIEGCGDQMPKVLFLVIHPKFVSYLKPIADELGCPYAFLTVDHPEMFAHLAEQDFPRVHIELTPKSQRMKRAVVRVFGLNFKPGMFDVMFVRLNAIKRALDRLAPRCVVVPEGNADVYELVNQAARTVAVPTLCVQQGWAPVVHPGFRNMSYDRMCVWGQRFADLLSPDNRQQSFAITGSHIIASAPQGSVSARCAVAFFLQNGAHWISDAVHQDMLDFIEWAAKEHPDYEIRVREHPGEPISAEDWARLSVLSNVRLMPPSMSPLRDVLAKCRVAIAINSTVILEAVASGIVPLILDISGWGPYHPDIARDGAAVEVTSFSMARSALGRLLRDDEFCASFSSRLEAVGHSLFARHGGEARRAIAAEIRQLSGSSRDSG